jgi:hypothetical protein
MAFKGKGWGYGSSGIWGTCILVCKYLQSSGSSASPLAYIFTQIVMFVILTISKLKTWKKRRTFKRVKHVFTVLSRKTGGKLKLVPRQRQYSTSYTEKQALQATLLLLKQQCCPSNTRFKPKTALVAVPDRYSVVMFHPSNSPPKVQSKKVVKTRRRKLQKENRQKRHLILHLSSSGFPIRQNILCVFVS